MLGILITIFLCAALAPWLYRVLHGATSWVLAVPVLAVTVWLASLVPGVSRGEVLLETRAWASGLGLDLAFRIDGWSLLFLLLVSGIGVLILIYAGGYLHGHRHEGRFYSFILFFMGSMLGVVSADNLLLLFIFWELTSFSSYLLIGFDHEKKESRAAALQALLVTGSGGLALMAGAILMAQVAGTWSLTEMMAGPVDIREHALYLPILLLILAGAFTKSAQTPFHFWLPGAMAAPTPVSAYLHSATMVTAGVFLLGRVNPLLGDTAAWNSIITAAGALTMLTGAALALPQTDLKRLLAYSTVSALGTMVLLLGMATELATKAAVVFLIVHSLYKGALFMVAGAIDHEAGTRDVRKLTGLVKVMPITAVVAGVSALSMSGLPPLLGFISKELLYEANLTAPYAGIPLTIIGVVANVFMVAVALIVGFRPFYGPPRLSEKKVHEPPLALLIGPVVLAVLGLAAGVYPALVDRSLVSAAVGAVRGSEIVVKLKIWHGLNLALLLSVVTVAAGVLVYYFRDHVRTAATKLAPLAKAGPENIYNKGLQGLTLLAAGQTRLLQHGYLPGYVLTVLAVVSILTGLALLNFGEVADWTKLSGVRFYEVVIGALILGSALVAAAARSRLAAVAGLGVVGYSVALIYGLHGAPDLAITQILVETLTLVLFVLVVVHLPAFSSFTSPRRRLMDAVFAAVAGGIITLLILKALYIEKNDTVSAYYAETALQAHGRNVVNVILVDFRALDTLGEIVVLTIAALGVYALLKLKPEKPKEEE